MGHGETTGDGWTPEPPSGLAASGIGAVLTGVVPFLRTLVAEGLLTRSGDAAAAAAAGVPAAPPAAATASSTAALVPLPPHALQRQIPLHL